MKQSKRLLAVIIAFGFMIGYIWPIQSYAQVVTTQNPQEAEADIPYYKTTGAGIELTTSGQAIKVTITGADIDSATTGTAIDSTTTGSAISTTTAQSIEVRDENDAKNKEDLWYRNQNPMKKEHQKLLWEYCKKRDLNYIDMLTLIYTESNFDEKCSTGRYYGYFQISKVNCANLSEKLKTKNKPLDGDININWGTAMYRWILADKRVKDLEGNKKRDVALSIYQRGSGGYDKYGISKSFLKVFYKKRAKVCGWFEVKTKN